MKRSKINQEIRHMENMIREHGFVIPPFCNWTPEEWKTKGSEYDCLDGILPIMDWEDSMK